MCRRVGQVAPPPSLAPFAVKLNPVFMAESSGIDEEKFRPTLALPTSAGEYSRAVEMTKQWPQPLRPPPDHASRLVPAN